MIGRYIADFACRIPRMLVIEVDGDTHAVQMAYDADRTALKSKGNRVLRFTNAELRPILEGVLTVIAEALPGPPSPTLSPEGAREKGSACSY